MLWVKDHAAVVKEKQHATIERLKHQLHCTLIHKQREALMYHPEMSGILTGLRFLKPYQDMLKQHSDLGPYNLQTMDAAIKILAQG